LATWMFGVLRPAPGRTSADPVRCSVFGSNRRPGSPDRSAGRPSTHPTSSTCTASSTDTTLRPNWYRSSSACPADRCGRRPDHDRLRRRPRRPRTGGAMARLTKKAAAQLAAHLGAQQHERWWSCSWTRYSTTDSGSHRTLDGAPNSDIRAADGGVTLCVTLRSGIRGDGRARCLSSVP